MSKSKPNIYETILDTYTKDLDQWRIMLYENMSKLMRRNPLLKVKNYTYTKEDILSEAFMIADEMILDKKIPYNKKVTRLRYLFNRWWWVLFNKINQYWAEIYNIDNLKEKDIAEYMEDDILNWILVTNNIITPMEEKVLSYLQEGRGKYEIARLLNASYYSIKWIADMLAMKINRFILENDIDANNS